MKSRWMWLVSLNLVALVIALTTLGTRTACAPLRDLRDLRDQLRGTVLNVTLPVSSPVPVVPVPALPVPTVPVPVPTVPTVQPEVVTVQPEVVAAVAPTSVVTQVPPLDDCDGREDRFVVEPCAELMADAAQAAHRFDEIYARQAWGSRVQELGTHTRSGLGSDMKGAFDWITGLTKFFNQNPELQTIADIPSGDMGWQMAVRHLNTAKLYFGGDIAKSVAVDNAKRYRAHENKILQHWDLYSCGVPKWSTTCNSTKNSFDVIMIRDALQHIAISKVQQILRKVILDSGAKWFITSSYPATDTLRTDPYGCSTNENLFCSKGAMPGGDGGWYPIALDCAPFHLPSPAFKTASHGTFKIENDFLYIYKIDDALKEAVLNMKPCPSFAPAKPTPVTAATPEMPRPQFARSFSRFRNPQ